MLTAPIRLVDKFRQAMGRTKGGLNTKIHAVVNARSQPIVIPTLSGWEPSRIGAVSMNLNVSTVYKVPPRSELRPELSQHLF